jgi:nicotinamidase-related amidase
MAFAISLAPAAQNGKEAKTLHLTLRSREPAKDSKTLYTVVMKEADWSANKTAIIVCDVWDAHHCLNAVRRLEEMVPRMNEVLAKARSQGVLIIHAPSDCMAAYKDHAGRKLAQAAPEAKNLPKDIGQWCNKIPAESKVPYPIDQSDGGEDDDLVEHIKWQEKLVAMGRNPKTPWKKQHEGIKMHEGDAISDSGVEIWNLLEHKGIDNVILLGVHTNMCVLGRPFGLRQMAKNGKNVVLMRDMTDTMYNPKMKPFVNHYQGTQLIIQYVEKCVCPTITSEQIAGGKEFHFKNDPNKTIQP